MRGHDVRLRTERLILRAPEPGDAGRIAALIDDPDVARMMSAIPHPYGLVDAEAFCAAAAAADPRQTLEFLAETPEGTLVGGLGLNHAERPFFELGYWVGRAYWGRGLAGEAAGAALAFARSEGRRAVTAGHFADNPASGRVLIKAGFLYTGEVERRYALARGEAVSVRRMVWLA